MKTVKAALFDLDGTLFDTEGQYTEIWSRIGRKYRPDVEDLALKIKGTTLKQIFARYFSDPDVQKAVTVDLNRAELDMEYRFFPGALEFVADLRAHGVKCAVVTSSNLPKMASVSRQIPLFNSYFDRILTSEDFKASKPDPDCYLLGARVFDCDVSECVVFEDAFSGLEAGRRAGMFTFGLATGNSPGAIKDKCDYVLTGFEGLDYAALVKITGDQP